MSMSKRKNRRMCPPWDTDAILVGHKKRLSDIITLLVQQQIIFFKSQKSEMSRLQSMCHLLKHRCAKL